MKLYDFTGEHIADAQKLAFSCYEEERRHVLDLPEFPGQPGFPHQMSGAQIPFLYSLAENGLGTAAYEDGKMVGYLCVTQPFEHAFGSTDVKGVFSPMGANGTVSENRENIYAALYQKAAAKWVREGAVSHGICLYAHDIAAQKQFFQYGFGMRCVDAVRLMEKIECEPCWDYVFTEIAAADSARIYPLEQKLNEHYCSSPFFMNRNPESLESFCRSSERGRDRFFTALYQGEVCAYLKISADGETFLSENPGYRHITGAYCLKEHRGKGVYQNLINYAVEVLKGEGYTWLGTDYESINPSGSGFWMKHFSEYTHGVVRRIDERILNRMSHLEA